MDEALWERHRVVRHFAAAFPKLQVDCAGRVEPASGLTWTESGDCPVPAASPGSRFPSVPLTRSVSTPPVLLSFRTTPFGVLANAFLIHHRMKMAMKQSAIGVPRTKAAATPRFSTHPGLTQVFPGGRARHRSAEVPHLPGMGQGAGAGRNDGLLRQSYRGVISARLCANPGRTGADPEAVYNGVDRRTQLLQVEASPAEIDIERTSVATK